MSHAVWPLGPLRKGEAATMALNRTEAERHSAPIAQLWWRAAR